jgi:uncharacterized OB-fold protein
MQENRKENETKNPCTCSQAAIDLLRVTSPIKEGMLRETKCKKCGKTFLTNFDTEYCFDCKRKLSIK